MLHENLGEAHRKHAYQIMANELKIGHVKVASLYALLQLAVSLGFIYIIPNTPLAHWLYLLGALMVLSIAYTIGAAQSEYGFCESISYLRGDSCGHGILLFQFQT